MIHMIRAFVLAICLPVCSFGQSDTLSIPRLVLKTNASTMLNPFKQAFAVGADVRLNPRVSVDLSLGYFLSSETFTEYREETYAGPRIRAGLKYHYVVARSFSLHIGLEGRYHYIHNWAFYHTLRQGGQYSELMRLLRTVETAGLALRSGAQFYMGKRKRFMLEPYLGLGASSHSVKLHPTAPDVQRFGRVEWASFEYQEGKSRTIDLLFGWHLGYAF